MALLMKKRIFAATLTLGFSLVGLNVVQSTPASAATTCLGGAKSFEVSGAEGSAGPYTTSSRCQDINLDVDGEGFAACVIFVDHTDRCNYHSFVYGADGWVTIATDVRDGTRFKVAVWAFEGGSGPLRGKVAS
jgi:hypothetical protein